ncbi:MAG TPA: MFS transporter [Planctomycetota bacterium]|nr:MFS transporter [Planctomycetota bacterium]
MPSGPRHWKRGSAVRHGLAIAVIEGLVVAAMLSFSESFIVPVLQTRLHATLLQIGFFTIIPLLGTVFTGIVLGRIIRLLGGNKRSVVLHALAQSLLIAGLSIPLHNPDAAWAVPVGIMLAVSIALAGSIGGPAWINWMGALVPRRIQSRYLAFRNRLVILVKLGFACLFAQILHVLPAEAGPWGLQALILIAVVSRLLSTCMIQMQHEPPPRAVMHLSTDHIHRTGSVSFRSFLRNITCTDLGRWTLVWAVLHFGVMLAGPYFAAYMLSGLPRGLGLSPGWTYVMLIQMAVLVRVAAFPLAGRLVDLFGPAAVLRVAVCGIMVVPIAWALTTTIPLLLLTEIISGLCWCMAEVAVGVLLFTCHRDPQERSHLIGYHQSVVNAVAVLGAAFGSIALARGITSEGSLLPDLVGSDFHTLFLLSALFRLPAVILAMRFLPKLRSLRAEESAGLWRMIPGADLTLTLSRGLMGFFRRPEG